MPFHKGLFPREGLCADVIFRLIRSTALNPSILLPLVLLARYTKQGEDLSILHATAASRLRLLLYISLVRFASSWVSGKVRNNWIEDKYDWGKEVVLVTGGAGGIGGCMVRMLEEKGVTVVVLDLQPMSFETSPKIHYFNCDLRSPSAIADVASKITSTVGAPTVIINNAGVARGKTILGTTPADLRLTFDVNAFAPFLLAQTFLPSMIRANHGMIVTVTSYAAWLCIPNMVDYGMSKAAALALHEGLTSELKTRYKAPGVRTVVVHPGPTKTALFDGYDQNTDFIMPKQEPESIAEAVVKQVLSGRSGSVVLPSAGWMLSSLRAMPDWYSYRVREKAHTYMQNFRGRQVIPDEADSGKEEAENEATGSTVLVSAGDDQQ